MQCAEWSATRPAVFFLGKADGSIEVWDLLHSTYAPGFSQNIATPLALTVMCTHGGDRPGMTTGDSSGTIHVLDIPDAFVRPVVNEVALHAVTLHLSSCCDA